jgi:hypothetical protein
MAGFEPVCRPPTPRPHSRSCRPQVCAHGFSTNTSCCWMRPRGPPSSPGANICCFFSLFRHSPCRGRTHANAEFGRPAPRRSPSPTLPPACQCPGPLFAWTAFRCPHVAVWMVTEGASRRTESTREKWTTVRPPSKTRPAFSSQLRRFAVLKNSVFRFLPRKTNPRQSHRRRFSTTRERFEHS